MKQLEIKNEDGSTTTVHLDETGAFVVVDEKPVFLTIETVEAIVKLSKKVKKKAARKAKRKALVQEMRGLSSNDKMDVLAAWGGGAANIRCDEYRQLIVDWLERKHSEVLDFDAQYGLAHDYIFKEPKK